MLQDQYQNKLINASAYHVHHFILTLIIFLACRNINYKSCHENVKTEKLKIKEFLCVCIPLVMNNDFYNINFKIREIKVTKLINQLNYLSLALTSSFPNYLIHVYNVILNIILKATFNIFYQWKIVSTIKYLMQQFLV